jgi:MscS family membrane protein
MQDSYINRNSLLRAVTLTLLGVLLSMPGKPQAAKLFGRGNTGATSAPQDALNRLTPRSSISSFLAACNDERFVAAARYLDLSSLPSGSRAEEGPELARDLASLLDQDSGFELSSLSDQQEGKKSDSLDANYDVLARLQINGSFNTLEMERVTQNQNRVWLVSADSVARLADLSALAGESEFEKALPQVLVSFRLVGTSIWIWIVLVGVAVVLSMLSRVLSHILIRVIRRLFKNVDSSLKSARVEAFLEPLRLLVSVSVFRAVMEIVNPSALLRDYLLRLLALLFAFGAAALTMRIVDVLADQILNRLDEKGRALSYSVLPLGVRVIKMFIFCIAVLFILTNWGYNTNAILAGLGVGGLAVALAGQKTIENLFGGISLISDRPVLVGDFCQFGGQYGTVEDIGLRSTRVRTLDRTVVTIPNSSFSTMTLENLSRRDRMWFHPTLHLRRDTPPDRLQAYMSELEKIMNDHPRVDASGVPLRFTQIANESLDLDIFAYVNTADYNEYLKVQTELLFRFLRASQSLDVDFAVPLTELKNIKVGEQQKGQTDSGQDGAPGARRLPQAQSEALQQNTQSLP